MNKKVFLAVSVLIAVGMLLAACGTAVQTQAPETASNATSAPASTEAAAGGSSSDTVNIGFISAFTGTFSGFGEMQKEGAVLALEEVNYTAGGKKLNIIYEDDQLDNELAVTKSKKLVEQDKVDVLTGMVSGDEGLSVGDYMKDKNIPVVPMYSASEDMTMRNFYPMIVRPTWTGAQPMDVFGYWIAKEQGYKKIYMIGEDYSYPYNQGDGFKRGFCRGGGTEVTTVWHPVNTTDYSSIIASIPLDQGYDAVLYNGAGSDAIAFVKQYVDLGMLSKLPLLGQSNTFEKPDVGNMPKDIVGSYSAHLTTDDLTTENWTKFSEAFTARWGSEPSAASEFAYSSMRMIIRAIDKLNGDVSDKTALVNAMKTVDLTDDPRGPVTLDDYNAAVENVYIREVATDANGNLYNKGLFKVENVSQFGPYDPQLYLSQPADSGSYPPDKCSDFPADMLTAASEYEFIPMGQ